MAKEERQKKILHVLNTCKSPVSGKSLAGRFNVSRQVIVQDITCLKASGHPIVSTHRGYLLETRASPQRIFKVRHKTGQIADELYTIVDLGGTVVDVFIIHEIYGELRASLSLSSRKDVDDFVAYLDEGKIKPLKHLTDDYHFHTVTATSETLLNLIEEKLKEKNYLISI